MMAPTHTAMKKSAFVALCIAFAATCILAAPLESSDPPKLDCYPLPGASKEKCEALGCVWSPNNHEDTRHKHGIVKLDWYEELSMDVNETTRLMNGPLPPKSDIREPWCVFPENYVGYKVEKISETSFKLVRTRPSGLPKDIEELRVNIVSVDKDKVRINIHDPNKQRYEPNIPEIHMHPDESKPAERNFESFYDEASGRLVVKRKSTGTLVFDTDLRRLIFADQFIQINIKLNSPYLYGLGEHYGKFLKLAANEYKAYSFFNTDKLPLPDGRKSYGIFPFYVSLESDLHHAHGVYLRNVNAMDVVLQPDQSITFRPIGGVLDFIVFAGPTPNDVVRQFQNTVGKPDLPPRWALGFHLCRYNYGSLNKTREVWARTRAAGIPFDVQWNDIDVMDRHNDFTYDPVKFAGLDKFVDEVHENDMHYVVLFDPGLSQEDNYAPYIEGKQADVFVKNASNQTLVGKVWNDSGRTVFPDFSKGKDTIDFWTKQFERFQKEVAFDGAWIDMNDISNFVAGSIDGCPQDSELEHPAYLPGGETLNTHTLCMSAQHHVGPEYDEHNLYSFYEAIATHKAMAAARPGKRPFVLSRSSSPGQNSYGGHWSGDVLSTWDYLRWSIPSLIEHSMYGYSMMGSDICGFVGNTTQELCARWSTLGAFYTFTRNHNDDVSIDQDPVALGDIVVSANKNALVKKYSLLPYLYTLVHDAHRYGEPVVRSVPFEFFDKTQRAQKIEQLLRVEDEFMWGSALLVSPIVEPHTTTKRTYLPEGRWYETSAKKYGTTEAPKLHESSGEEVQTDNIGLDDIALFYRGGNIVPVYLGGGRTTIEIAKQPLGLEIALCERGHARGQVILDAGDNVDGKHNHIVMQVQDGKLTIKKMRNEHNHVTKLNGIRVYGVDKHITKVTLNNNTQLDFRQQDHMLTFSLAAAELVKGKDVIVDWS